jgi:hypothetical protein
VRQIQDKFKGRSFNLKSKRIITSLSNIKAQKPYLKYITSNTVSLKSQLQSAAHNMELLALLLSILLFTTSSTSYPFEGKPVFTLKDITYSSQIIYSTPAHLAVADGHIEFNLTNSAVPYTTHCSGSSEWLYDFFYGNIVYICDARTGEGVAKGASANFTFSNPAGTFAVNQTWSEPSRGHDERDEQLSA